MLKDILTKYEMVIGLEVHAQLKSKTKLMSASSNQFGETPNTSVSTICTGMPGALPVLNHHAVELATRVALALDCKVQETSVFSRKHYFYPDLPKGYQISQYDLPYALGGRVSFHFENQVRSIRLTRIHMEEDAGKNLHLEERHVSLVDLNRSSVPLIEIVSEPEIRSPEEAAAYLKALRLVLRYLDVCDGNLEEGNFRCDANVSIRPIGQKTFGTRVELKNINSFKNLEKAIEYEVVRQYDLIESGQKIHQETRLWDAEQNKSHGMRSKEDASDYRYMPEPDLLPLRITEETLDRMRPSIPELPMKKMARFQTELQRSLYDSEVLTASPDLARYFEDVVATVEDPHLASNFIQTNVLAKIADIDSDLKDFYPDQRALSDLLLRVKDGTLSLGMAKEVFESMLAEKKSAAEIIKEKGLAQVNDQGSLESVIEKVLSSNPKQLADFRSGKDKLFGFFMGQCQKELGGKANPVLLKEILEKKLKSS